MGEKGNADVDDLHVHADAIVEESDGPRRAAGGERTTKAQDEDDTNTTETLEPRTGTAPASANPTNDRPRLSTDIEEEGHMGEKGNDEKPKTEERTGTQEKPGTGAKTQDRGGTTPPPQETGGGAKQAVGSGGSTSMADICPLCGALFRGDVCMEGHRRASGQITDEKGEYGPVKYSDPRGKPPNVAPPNRPGGTRR